MAAELTPEVAKVRDEINDRDDATLTRRALERANALVDTLTKERDTLRAELARVTGERDWQKEKRETECSYCGCPMDLPRHERECPVELGRAATARAAGVR